VRTRRRAAAESGFTMVEVIVSMIVLSLVMTGIMTLFVDGTRTETDLRARFDAQTEVNVGLARLTRDVHAACSATAQSATSVTLSRPPCDGTSIVTWCTRGSGSRYGLYRVTGSTCSGGARYADYLIGGSVFSYLGPNSPSGSYALARVRADLTVDANASTSGGRYAVISDIVFRNSARQ
jgi:prepilin-type N-terminal cleavage/methylation domain-containing protein